MTGTDYWIEKLSLIRHPEGGFYSETYRAALELPPSVLPDRYTGSRRVCTAIYFLLQDEDFSAFHRIASDEMWHFYAGDSLAIHVIDQDGQHQEIKLGPRADDGECFQAVVPGGNWFASCLSRPTGFALVGCTVSPGFDFADFEMADRSVLSALYPKHDAIIHRLTRVTR